MPSVAESISLAAAKARIRLRALLGEWFPRCLSDDGGFHQAFARDWTRLPETTRFQVFQCRMTWVAAVAAEAFPESKEEFVGYLRHGLEGLTDALADREFGGMLWRAGMDGQPRDDGAAEKRSYGLAFEIYAFTAAAKVLQDVVLAARAFEAFEWLERLHDPLHGGWFEAATRDGTPIPGDKVFNSHLHIFEALIELRRLAPGGRVEDRFRQLTEILAERFFTPSGRMSPRFDQAWNPLSDDWEIGHDLEAAYLLLMAEPDTQSKARALKTVDFALENGFDPALGGFFELGKSDGSVSDGTKGYWTQDEGLNALAFAWKATGDLRYGEALLKQWQWVADRQYDSDFGGTFARLTAKGAPIGSLDKADPWKACYHDVRALLNLAIQCSNPHSGGEESG